MRRSSCLGFFALCLLAACNDMRLNTGALKVIISGLPEGAEGDVTIDGPDGFNQHVTSTEELGQLASGSYSASASMVTSTGVSYTPAITGTGSPVTVIPEPSGSISVVYTELAVPPRDAGINAAGNDVRELQTRR